MVDSDNYKVDVAVKVSITWKQPAATPEEMVIRVRIDARTALLSTQLTSLTREMVETAINRGLWPEKPYLSCESIGRRGNSFQIAINGWAYIVQRGINEIGVTIPGWTVESNGRAYEFDCAYDGVFIKLPLAELTHSQRKLISYIAKKYGYR